jgi:hypothetical protein
MGTSLDMLLTFIPDAGPNLILSIYKFYRDPPSELGTLMREM